MGAKHGILFKTAVSLEQTGKVQIVALDKTGTITRGEPSVTDLVPAEGVSERELLQLAYALEQKSEHPLAKAIVAYGEEQQITVSAADDFQAMPGNGLSGIVSGARVFGGNLKFISGKTTVSEQMQRQAEELAKQGKTPLFFATEEKLFGIIAVADVIKEDSPQAISQLQNMGIEVVMLTGVMSVLRKQLVRRQV
ncbi:MAG: HAD-IC family P-type ATPase [Eubacterium ramulus]